MYKRGSLMSPCSTSSCPNSHSGPPLCVAALVVDSLLFQSELSGLGGYLYITCTVMKTIISSQSCIIIKKQNKITYILCLLLYSDPANPDPPSSWPVMLPAPLL